MKPEARQTILATLSSVFLFLILALGIKWNIIISAVLALGTYYGVYNISKHPVRLGNTDIDALENGIELKELMDEGEKDMAVMKQYTDIIKSPDIRKSAEELYTEGNNILQYLRDNPGKISKARRFLNYYLETAKEIIVKYAKFEKTDIKTEELAALFEKTEKALDILKSAFRKQFVKLASNEIMDIEQDIDLLEKTLKEEG